MCSGIKSILRWWSGHLWGSAWIFWVLIACCSLTLFHTHSLLLIQSFTPGRGKTDLRGVKCCLCGFSPFFTIFPYEPSVKKIVTPKIFAVHWLLMGMVCLWQLLLSKHPFLPPDDWYCIVGRWWLWFFDLTYNWFSSKWSRTVLTCGMCCFLVWK